MPQTTIYTSPTCAYCHMLRTFLEENSVEFEEINVMENREAAQKIVDETGQMGVPVTEIDGTYIIGFAKDSISEKLGLDKK